MHSHDGRYHIVYNGEVYNYRQLRQEVESSVSFESNCDTEVVLQLFIAQGPSMLDKLNGMFAIAIWDSSTKQLFLARDRLGVKPLYYAIYEGKLYFASEPKALFAAGVPAEFNSETWEELLCFRYIAGERTPFSGVKRLLPGHYLIWQDGKIVTKRWWNLSERAQSLQSGSVEDATTWYRDIFDDSVSLRRISDVPVGVLLSGGLDSSSVAASLGAQGARDAACFTMRFSDSYYDEGAIAKSVTTKWGLAFHECFLQPENLLERLEQASWFSDDPLIHGNDAHLWAVAELAKPHVKVLLSGEGADETLGGYIRYQPLRWPQLLQMARLAKPFVQLTGKVSTRANKLLRFLQLGQLDRFVLFNSSDVVPADLREIGFETTGALPFREEILAEAISLYPTEPMRQVMYYDQHTFLCSLLDRNDRMTMAASIECRVPFLDFRIVEQLAALPTQQLIWGKSTKQLIRGAFEDRLPTSVLQHRKWGFGVPWGKYMRENPLLRAQLEAIPISEPICNGPFDCHRLRQIIDEFLNGNDRRMLLLRQLLLVAIWHRTYFQRANHLQLR
jgi:asparagine synthase (glutamine-hydrolysing)